MDGNVGDYVEVSLVKKEYKGTILESPKNEKGILLLKLDSGYNIGINRKDLLDVKILKKFSGKEESFELKKDKEKQSIAMVMTGGTITSKLDSKTGGVKWLTSPEKLFQNYPQMFKHVNLLKVESPFTKDSGEMDPKDWKIIAKTVYELMNNINVRGIIVTHGTDSLHYTAAALSFFLRNVNKPIVLTYSQRSTDRASSDAALNLECSALISISDIGEVVLVGHSSSNDDFCYVLRGTKVRKLHSTRRDAFKPVNVKPIAKVFPDLIQNISDYRTIKSTSEGKEKPKLDDKFEEKVALIKYYPGQDPNILDYYLKNGYKGIVIEFLGLGQIAAKEARNNWIPKLKEVQQKGMIVCATAQTIYGRLDPLVYSTGRELMETGVIYLKDMLSETAYVKLGWVLGHSEWSKDKEKVKEKMLENVAGEFNERLEFEEN
jgi:glutamyl-tRNA(Gln) amidotransferase subunit D